MDEFSDNGFMCEGLNNGDLWLNISCYRMHVYSWVYLGQLRAPDQSRSEISL